MIFQRRGAECADPAAKRSLRERDTFGGNAERSLVQNSLNSPSAILGPDDDELIVGTSLRKEL